MTSTKTANPVKFKFAVRCPKCGKEALCYLGGMFQKSEAVVSCTFCAYKKSVVVNWPTDAFYKMEVSEDVPWGWLREHFVSVRECIASEERKQNYQLHRNIPARAFNVKRRGTVVKAIDQLLKTT